MKILVTTPTGRIGSRIARELVAPEFSLRVLLRNPARLPSEIRASAEVIHGSLDDSNALRRALDGVEAMFFCIPPDPITSTDIGGHYDRFARVAARAIRDAGTPRVVTISAMGKGRAHQAGPISALHAMEDTLNESGAAIRHLRCAPFMENLLGQAESLLERGMLTYPMPSHVAMPMVAVTDVADAALRWLARGDWSGIEAVPVHGPEDLSYGQVAAHIERILDQSVRYEEAPANTWVQSLVARGASVEHARSRVAMFAELAKGIAQAGSRTAETTAFTTFASWVRIELIPLLDPNLVAGCSTVSRC